MADKATVKYLTNLLNEELQEGYDEDDFVVSNLRRQIAAAEIDKTAEELYVTGSVRKE
jgi:hypothetical protein